MKSIFALLGVCLALGYVEVGCGEAANATSDVEPVLKAGEEESEMCRTPGSRASFLKAALAEEKRVANVEPLTAEEVAAALAEEIIGARSRAGGGAGSMKPVFRKCRGCARPRNGRPRLHGHSQAGARSRGVSRRRGGLAGYSTAG